jgi:S-adenosylmethionine:tRNA ribosyltransferase-isomerase
LKSIPEIELKSFDYNLPEEKIARHPAELRDLSKLLVYKKGVINDAQFRDIEEILNQDHVLVFNNAKVINARLSFQKDTGARIEIFCLEPHSLTPEEALSQQGEVLWNCMVGGAKRWKSGNLTLRDEAESGIELSATMVRREEDHFVVKLSWTPSHYSCGEIIQKFGNIPLPPYIKRSTTDQDIKRYQTVYARNEGSVAAPTAGLHFTEDLLNRIRKRGVEVEEVTLHVGAGTFKPMVADDISEHEMHHELIEMSLSALSNLATSSREVIAVGTTSMRTLESLYWLGMKAIHDASVLDNPVVNQWDPYEFSHPSLPWREVYSKLGSMMETKGLQTIRLRTGLIIIPGYQIQVARTLITNFHMPSSTLLLLVAALVGEDWKRLYNHALNNDYRFLSFGDSSILSA